MPSEVISVSARGAPPEWARSEAWVDGVEWRRNELTRGAREALAEAIGAPDVVVSCVGAVGFDRQGLLLGNGAANVEGVRAARAAGAQRFVYVSVASEVGRRFSEIRFFQEN